MPLNEVRTVFGTRVKKEEEEEEQWQEDGKRIVHEFNFSIKHNINKINEKKNN